MDAAARLIAANGSRSTSLSEIGHEAGYSRGIVNHQFGTKAALLRAVVIAAQADFAPVESASSGLEQTLATVSSYIRHLAEGDHKGNAALVLWAEATRAEPGLKALFHERDTWFRSTVADQVLVGITDGTVRSDLDPQVAAMAVVGLLRGIGLQLLVQPGAIDGSRLEAEVIELVRRSLSST